MYQNVYHFMYQNTQLYFAKLLILNSFEAFGSVVPSAPPKIKACCYFYRSKLFF